MSDYIFGAIKLNNGPNGLIKVSGFKWLDFALQTV